MRGLGFFVRLLSCLQNNHKTLCFVGFRTKWKRKASFTFMSLYSKGFLVVFGRQTEPPPDRSELRVKKSVLMLEIESADVQLVNNGSLVRFFCIGKY
jgi:hypothetical protein